MRFKSYRRFNLLSTLFILMIFLCLPGIVEAYAPDSVVSTNAINTSYCTPLDQSEICILQEDIDTLGFFNQSSTSTPILLAQSGDDKKKVRKRRLSTEGKFKRSGDKTTIDFDSVDIVGSRRTPLGSMINQSRANKDYDFVKVRLRWHPEMINSASSLDTGN